MSVVAFFLPRGWLWSGASTAMTALGNQPVGAAQRRARDRQISITEEPALHRNMQQYTRHISSKLRRIPDVRLQSIRGFPNQSMITRSPRMTEVT